MAFAARTRASRRVWITARSHHSPSTNFTVNETQGTYGGGDGHTQAVITTSLGLWSSGDLSAFLFPKLALPGLSKSSPANPFSAFTVGADSGITGFDVYLADLGAAILLNQSGSSYPVEPTLTLGGSTIQTGFEITSFLVGSRNTVATAPSSVLQAGTTTVPEPGTSVLLGIGFIAIVMASRRTRLALASRG